ncbi:MAG: 1-deoxy-D-xylulose-5-phosphate reductoisomerase [Coriobacteriales bacterium]|jgi:1-deoxy-D-xylulose-5-phosphate reductoisomerase|nr:1-deoxy-D-xylulose-5-phosphate reductoisomerase [Coriobacteriales bacterium]
MAAPRTSDADYHPLRIAVLGSTGSIGRQALKVITANPEQLQVVALAAGSNQRLLQQQAQAFNVKHVALAQMPEANTGSASAVPIAYGADSVVALTELDEVDCVLNALVGSAGLQASYNSLLAGKRLALANKESLVVGGDLLMPLAKPGQLIPVDSEHSAIFQCLIGEKHSEVAGVWLTASGGPFRGSNREYLRTVTAAQALAHPTWQMGAKISIDSATLMNKGLEFIEAIHLFALTASQIKIVVHPQSVIHSMVQFCDGSVKAQLGQTDMRIPIQYAFSYPARWPGLLPELDFTSLGNLEFYAADIETFGCLRLALEAAHVGGTSPAVLNAANEVAVAAFLADRIGFLDIELCVQTVLAEHSPEVVASIDQLLVIDTWARQQAVEFLQKGSR